LDPKIVAVVHKWSLPKVGLYHMALFWLLVDPRSLYAIVRYPSFPFPVKVLKLSFYLPKTSNNAKKSFKVLKKKVM
jgi:hypothetical protein